MKTENKFTEGTWIAFPDSTLVFGPDKIVVADTSPPDAFRASKEAKANAQLISSAPELLDCLEAIVIQLDGSTKQGETLHDYLTNAKLAIIKAKNITP